MADELERTLAERGALYGPYQQNAECCDALCDVLNKYLLPAMSAVETQAAWMLMHKMARIVCGAPKQRDSWHDIAGYATLVVEWIDEQTPKVEQ